MSVENKILIHIQKNLLEKYDDLESCNMYELPEMINADVEYIFKLKNPLFKQQLDALEQNLMKDVTDYCNNENEPLPRILLIFTEI